MPIPNPSSPGVSPVEWPAEGGVDDSAVALVVLLAGLLAGLLVEVEVMVGSYVVEANEHLRTISFASIKVSIMRPDLPCHQRNIPLSLPSLPYLSRQAAQFGTLFDAPGSSQTHFISAESSSWVELSHLAVRLTTEAQASLHWDGTSLESISWAQTDAARANAEKRNNERIVCNGALNCNPISS